MIATFSADSGGGPSSPPGEDPPTTMVPPRRPGIFAVIHVGAREAGLRVSRLIPDGSFHRLRQERDEFNPLGAPAPDPRRLAIRLADILSRYQRIAELHGAAVRAVATQSFRVLPNHAQMLHRLPRVTRVALELITDREKARFVCLGALRGRPSGHQAVVLDVGEDATSVILANAQEPLALWRLGLGTAQFLGAAGPNPSEQPDGIRTRAWRRQVQQILALGHLEAIRGAAQEATLVRRRGTVPTAVEHLAAVTALNEIAVYLDIRNVQSTEHGLSDGILIELSRASSVASQHAASSDSSASGPRRHP